MQKIVFPILLILVVLEVESQQVNNFRKKTILVTNDSIVLDTLTIVPYSVILYNSNKKVIPDTLYSIDYIKKSLFFSKYLIEKEESLDVGYRVFPLDFSKVFYNRNIEDVYIKEKSIIYPATNINVRENDFFSSNQLNKNGSIARGITVGNNQDAVINSDLNLQISGKLNNDMSVLAVISDENIPLQPDGNSQQIQDFDKVFIQLYNDRSKIIGGDFEIYKPQGYFMQVNKKAQGLLVNSSFKGKKNKTRSLETTISGAVSKGKYCRKLFQGQEGNQGPYKLTGCENEQFIIVLAGTEKVYIDGRLLSRGKEYDYVIDYNTGEVSFTANRLITKDSRIVVEFEYSERSYARFLIFSTNELQTEKGKFWLNVYSEQDSKNQPINQDLNNEQKQLLAKSGDKVEDVFTVNADSVGFNSDYVLYALKDTLLNGVVYEIYEYSTNPLNAFYQVGFSFTGENKGNYVQVLNSANGRVFEWVAPVSGVPQGNYEPVRLLVTPKKQQMISLGSELSLGKGTYTDFEFALSNYDLNTFSDLDASDNTGYAFKLDVDKRISKGDSLKRMLKTSVAYQLLNRNFTSIEKFRPVEFERDWNINKPFSNDEHFAEAGLFYRYKDWLWTDYHFGVLMSIEEYNGYRNRLNFSLKKSGYEFKLNTAYLNTSTDSNETVFVRYLANVSKSLSFVKAGIKNEIEKNMWSYNQTDSLLQNSFSFSSYGFFIQNPDSFINRYSASYTFRDDYLPFNNSLKHSNHAEDFQVGFGLLKNPCNIVKTNFIYRKLSVIDSSLSQQKEENNITGKVDYIFRLFKGAVSSSLYYEAGSGLEPKREYLFLKVSSGKGVYTWNDYNDNGIAELNEFEVAQFQDEANYIRVFSPSNEFIKVFSNEFNQVFNVKPAIVWQNSKGLKKFISCFSNIFAFQVSQKTTDDLPEHNLNPFYSPEKNLMINLNQNFRNTFSYQHPNRKFGTDYIYQQNSNKVLLSNGFDERNKKEYRIKLRWNFFNDFILQNDAGRADKLYSSEFFSSKNYKIESFKNVIKVQYQPGIKTKFELNYTYLVKDNKLSVEKSIMNSIGSEINYSITKKGNVLLKGTYINISFSPVVNTSIAYEMLEGLKPGNNATWNVVFNRKLKENFELNFLYSGRLSENSKAIHTGNVQIRAFF